MVIQTRSITNVQFQQSKSMKEINGVDISLKYTARIILLRKHFKYVHIYICVYIFIYINIPKCMNQSLKIQK